MTVVSRPDISGRAVPDFSGPINPWPGRAKAGPRSRLSLCVVHQGGGNYTTLCVRARVAAEVQNAHASSSRLELCVAVGCWLPFRRTGGLAKRGLEGGGE